MPPQSDELPAESKLVPLIGEDGNAILFDIYIGGQWIGSKGNIDAAIERIRWVQKQLFEKQVDDLGIPRLSADPRKSRNSK